MQNFKQLLLIVIFTFIIVASGHAETPDNWKEMEVEAKWTVTKNAFERMISEFEDGESNFGFAFRVRWSGIPRKFVDYYYDSSNGLVTSDLHSLRHRTRLTSKPLATDRSLSTLINSNWVKNWERIQYKSTPRRIGAVWFRKEVGDCKIWDNSNSGLCPNSLPTIEASKIINDPIKTHAALTLLSSDHPNIKRKDLKPFLIVTDFRYRVVFVENDKDIFEVSLDHLITENLLTGSISREYEAELEIIASDPTDENLADLFRVSKLLEARYTLTPSTSSKGGNEVPEYD